MWWEVNRLSSRVVEKFGRDFIVRFVARGRLLEGKFLEGKNKGSKKGSPKASLF